MTVTSELPATTKSVTVTSISTTIMTSVMTTERLSTITTGVTELVGLPVEFTY